jgi:hypothetical protein
MDFHWEYKTGVGELGFRLEQEKTWHFLLNAHFAGQVISVCFFLDSQVRIAQNRSSMGTGNKMSKLGYYNGLVTRPLSLYNSFHSWI